ncbi:MAG TPA: hypothetical protein VMB72_12140 [Acidimicrobiales bacterium]|nr:hypothetical protein [Acidimicrobiales bacterium]
MVGVEVSGGDGSYLVEVTEASSTTAYTVTVPPGMAADLGWGGREEALVAAAFAFLLEREPPGAILRRFGLEVITSYFPEFPAEITRRARV